MPPATLVNATDLTAWANRRDAQDVLPMLMRRLVHATVERPLRVGFPAGEGVQLGGWDGIVAVEDGTAFVPRGTSAWELSVNGGVAGKADGDYEKRCRDPRGIDPAQSAFVFVTARRWNGKEDWAARRQQEGLWREVRAYDCDDLESWFENAAAVHIWFSILVGKHPEGAEDLGSWWSDWASVTRPPMTSSLVLSGRGEVAQRVRGWVGDPTQATLSIQADSREEALAAFAAAIRDLPAEERVVHLSRTVVVRERVTLHRLTASAEPLILILGLEDPDAVGRATRTGHRVVVPLGRADSTSANTVSVPRLSNDDATSALIEMGLHRDRAVELAHLRGGAWPPSVGGLLLAQRCGSHCGRGPTRAPRCCQRCSLARGRMGRSAIGRHSKRLPGGRMRNIATSSCAGLFLSDARTEVLPIHLWQIIETSLDVRAAAASGLLILITLALLLIAERLAGLTKQLHQPQPRRPVGSPR